MKSFMILCRNSKPKDLNIDNISGLVVSFGILQLESKETLGVLLDDNNISEFNDIELQETYKDWKTDSNELVLYLAEHDSANGVKIIENSNKRFRNQNSL